MKIKVYNENGIIKVVKVTANGTEIPMFSNIADGEVATIDIKVANISINAWIA